MTTRKGPDAARERPAPATSPAAPHDDSRADDREYDRGDLAALVVARPVLTAVLLALVPTIFDLFGNWGGSYASTHTAAAKVSSTTLWLLVLATCMSLCALMGVFAMAQAGASMREFGWRRPVSWTSLAWTAPLVLLAGVWWRDGLVRYGTSEAAAAINVVVLAVASVVWFQGFVQSVLRPRGRRYAMVTTAVIAALVGELPQLVGQVGLRPEDTGAAMPHMLTRAATILLANLVASGLVELTGSLWVPMVVRVLIEVAVLFGLALDVQFATVPALVALAVLAVWAGCMYARLPPDPAPDAD